MASEGPNNPATSSDDASIGTIAWAGVGNIFTSNNVYATVTLGAGEISHYLLAKSFGFSTVTGTINGFQVDIEANTAGDNFDYRVRLWLSTSGFVGDNKSTGAGLPIIDAYTTYGGAADNWNSGIGAGEVSQIGVGYAVTANIGGTASVDHVRMTITFTAFSAANTPIMQQPVEHILFRRQDVVAYKWIGRRWFEEKTEFVGWTERGPQFRETRYAGIHSNRSLNNGHAQVQHHWKRYQYCRHDAIGIHRNRSRAAGTVRPVDFIGDNAG
jgi:hypothetical protein